MREAACLPTWHEAALLQPEDGAEGAGEEDPLDAAESNEPLCKRLCVIYPLCCPCRLCSHRRNVVNGIKEVLLFLVVSDVVVNQKAECRCNDTKAAIAWQLELELKVQNPFFGSENKPTCMFPSECFRQQSGRRKSSWPLEFELLT